MGKIYVFIIGLIIISVVSYIQFFPKKIDPKESIKIGLEQISRSGAKISLSQEELLRLQLAITNYISSNGQPPDSLESLVPRYFDKVPKDPKTNEPYQYVRDGMRYRLGAQVAAGASPESSVVVAKVSEGSDKKIESGSELINVDNVINPNTLDIEEFVYDAKNKRDPFVPFDQSINKTVDETVPPLERYALGQLTVSAVLTDERKGATALVEDTEGKGYTVRLGSRIGNQNGVVAVIDKTGISVVETVRDFTGKEDKRATFMKIQPRAVAEKNQKGKNKSRESNSKPRIKTAPLSRFNKS